MNSRYRATHFRKRTFHLYLMIMLWTGVALFTENEVLARRNFMIERPKLDFKLSSEFEHEERTGPNFDRRNYSMTFFEGIDINTGGYIYHPALIEYKLELSPQWEQYSHKIEEPEEDTLESRTFLEGYNAEADFLQFKPYSLRVVGSRRRLSLNRNFAERVRDDINTYGATLLFKYKTLPTVLDYLHTDSKQTAEFNTDREKEALRLTMRYNEHLGNSRLNVLYRDENTTTRGVTVGVLEEKAEFLNSYYFGKEKNLRSYLEYRNIEGDTTRSERYAITENYSWRPGEHLYAGSNLRYETNDFFEARSEVKSADLNLTHKLYQSLTTNVNAFALNNQYPEGKEREYGSGLNLQYVKKIPGGTLRLNAANTYVITDRDVTEEIIQVRDETVTLTTGTPTFLENRSSFIDSVEVWDDTRTIRFQEGLDYRLEQFDALIRISCVQGGLIDTNLDCSDGAAVLVDYRYISQPAFDFSTYNQSYGIILNFALWNVFYNYYHSEERFLRGIEPEGLLNDEIHSAGTELTWKWSTISFSYTDNDTANAPRRSWRAAETITARPHSRVYVSVAANFERNKFIERDDDEEIGGAIADLQVLLSRQSKLSFKGFRHRISGQRERTTMSGLSAMFEWISKTLQASIQYEYRTEDDDIFMEQMRKHYFYVEVKTERF